MKSDPGAVATGQTFNLPTEKTAFILRLESLAGRYRSRF